jgi:DNA-binding response OmpR family regulator
MVRILIVVDEPSYRDYLSRFLTREHYDVQSAAGQDEALGLSELSSAIADAANCQTANSA